MTLWVIVWLAGLMMAQGEDSAEPNTRFQIMKKNIYFLQPDLSSKRVGAGYECGDFAIEDGEEGILVSGDDRIPFECTTNIESPPGTTISIECPHFDLPSRGSGCDSESLVIIDPVSGQSITACKRNAPSFTTSSNLFQMVHTRNLGNRDCTGGFMCAIRAGGKPQSLAGCKKQTIGYNENAIVFSANDGEKTKCKHVIQGPKGSNLVMNCPIFSLRDGCSKEKITFKNKFGLESSQNTFCGTDAPSGTSKTNKLILKHIRKRLRKNCSGGFLCLVAAEEETSGGNRPFCSGCGVSQVTVPRIVNGQEATPGEYPWQALLDFGNGVICGGTLIKPSWVLTAAHCFVLTGYTSATVVLGEHDRSTSDSNTQTYTSSNIITHPQYDDVTQDNDIALVSLNQDAVLNSRVQTICLAQSVDYVSGANTIATGWGVPVSGSNTALDTLHEVSLELISPSSCKDLYSSSYTITDNMVCTLTQNKDTCQGDSGGPIITQIADGTWVQLGIVSFGDGCAKDNAPGVYTKVSNYISWIAEQTGSNQCS